MPAPASITLPPLVCRDFTAWQLDRPGCFVGAYRTAENRWEVLHLGHRLEHRHGVHDDREDAETSAEALWVVLKAQETTP